MCVSGGEVYDPASIHSASAFHFGMANMLQVLTLIKIKLYLHQEVDITHLQLV